MADEVFGVDFGVFRAEAVLGEADGGYGAGVDGALYAGASGFLEDGSGSFHVDLVDLGGVAGPEGVHGGAVEEALAAFEGAGEGVSVQQVAGDPFYVDVLEGEGVAVGADEGADVVAPLYEGTGEVAADEAGCAGYEDFHGAIPRQEGKGEDGFPPSREKGGGVGWAPTRDAPTGEGMGARLRGSKEGVGWCCY